MATAVNTAIEQIFSVTNSVINMIQNNPLFMIYAASGVVSIGIGVVRKLIGRY